MRLGRVIVDYAFEVLGLGWSVAEMVMEVEEDMAGKGEG